MRIGLFFFSIVCLSLPGCWRDGSNQDFFIASEPVVCSVTFDFLSITLPDATETVAYADTTSLFSVTSGGVPPYFYSGTFDAAANLVVEADGDVVSGAGGAGLTGVYTTTVVVVDSTGICTDSITVSITINPSTPAEICNNLIDDDGDGFPDCADADCVADPFCVINPPRIDPAGTVDHANSGGGGTDSVSGSALSGTDAIPDFVGVQSNASGAAADRVFVIDIDSDGVGIDPLTVNTTNVTIFEVSTFSPVPPAAYTAVLAGTPPAETITVTIPGGIAGIGLVNGGTYTITLTPGIMNLSGDPFQIAPTAINSVVFLTAPDRDTLIFTGLNASGPNCILCHDGTDPGVEQQGGIAFPPPPGVTSSITLDFTTSPAVMFSGTSLFRVDAVTPGRTYVSLGAVAGFGAFDPNGSVLVHKLMPTPSFGAQMPLFGEILAGSVTPITGGPADPDTGATITGEKFMNELRSWIRGGAPALPE